MAPKIALWLARRLVRLAALRAPELERDRFLREWEGELAHGASGETGWGGVRAALGAFADVSTLRALEHADREGTMRTWMNGWWNDVTVALRSMARTPGFTVVAVLTLALGIGGSAAIWTLVDRVVVHPLPYPEPERLVHMDNQVPGVGPDEVWSLSTAQWVYFTDHAKTLDEVGIYQGNGGTVITQSGADRVTAVAVTASVMDLLGARATVGRVITPNDDQPGAPLVAMISEGFWRRALGADRGVVGTTLTFNDHPVEIIGVMAIGIDPPGWPANVAPDLWTPMQVDRAGTFWNSHVFQGIGRMGAGATPESVEAEIAGLTAQLPEAFPNAYSQAFFDQYGFRTQVEPLKEYVVGNLARNLWILFAGMLLVLLIAAANVANLFLVRMEGRRRELGIRAALGAGRGVLARHVLAESMTLALAGALVALVVGYWGVPALTSLAPPEIPRVHGAAMGLGTVGFTLGMSVLVGLALAAYPLVVHAGPGASRNLAEGGRGASTRPGAHRLRGVLVVAQVALALTLVVGAGLLVETLAKLRRTDPGFDPQGVVAVKLTLSHERYPNDVAVWNAYRDILDGVGALPGVAAAGMSEEVPVEGGFGCTVQGFEDATVYARVKDAGMTTCAGQEATAPGYFEAMRIPVLEGRTFTDGDNTDSNGGTVVVSKAFADRFWPGEDPIGQGIAPSGRSEGPFYRVVGVVGDVARHADEGEVPLSKAAIAVYYPIRQVRGVKGAGYGWPGSITLVARTTLDDPTSLVPAIRRVVTAIDPQIPLANATTMDDVVASASAQITFVSILLGIAAVVALILAAVGLYGVVSYVVSRRTREIGMRMAIGAEPGRVQRMVVTSSLGLVAAGLVVGIGLALATTRVLEGLLVGVEPTDAGVYAAAAGVLAVVATVASWLPARRASRIDPVRALREE